MMTDQPPGFDLTTLPAGFHDDPYHHYARLREKDPVCWQPDGSVLLSRYGDLDRVYRDTTTFISDKKAVFGPKYGVRSPLYEHHTTSLVFNDAPLHTRVRSIMVGAMAPRAIQRMEPGLIAVVDRFVEDMGEGETAEIIEQFAGRIPIEVIGNLLDIPHEERGPLRAWSLEILGALEPALSERDLDAGNRAVLEFKSYLRDLVARRRKSPGDPDVDVLTRLIQSDVDGGLLETELLQNCIFILNAGHETTTNLIANALWIMDRDRDARREVIADPTLLPGAVEETLRLESSNQFGNRLTARDVEFHGQKIPAGTDLHLCIAAANRDGEKFPDPDRFDPRRKPNKHLAFGGGAHTCVGLTLARMEGRIALGTFLKRFPDYRITGHERGTRIRFRGFTSQYVALG